MHHHDIAQTLATNPPASYSELLDATISSGTEIKVPYIHDPNTTGSSAEGANMATKITFSGLRRDVIPVEEKRAFGLRMERRQRYWDCGGGRR